MVEAADVALEDEGSPGPRPAGHRRRGGPAPAPAAACIDVEAEKMEEDHIEGGEEKIFTLPLIQL